MNCVSWGLLLAPAVAGQTWSSREVLPIEILHLFSLRCGAVWRCLVWLNAEHSVWDWRVPARFGLTRFSSVACRHRCRWTKQVLSVKNNLKRWVPSAFLLTSPLMWKSIYGYAFPLRRSVTYRPKMRSKQTRCSLVAVREAPAQRGVLLPISRLMGILVDFLWLSVDHLGAAASREKVIKSKYVIWRLFKAAEMALCTQHTEREEDRGRYRTALSLIGGVQTHLHAFL